MSGPHRIVSLIASATEIVAALGAADELVGRSHECDFPPRVVELPCCTRPRIDVNASSGEIDAAVKRILQEREAGEALSIYEVFDDVLERLQPTHIITQTQCDVCAVSLKDVERSIASRLRSAPQIVSLQPNSLADIWLDIARVAGALSIDAQPLIAALQRRIERVSAAANSPASRPRVACIEWMDPLMAAGNWCPELVELAGGENLFGEAGKHSPWLGWGELVASAPDVVILMPCGFDLERTRREASSFLGHPSCGLLKADIWLADGNQYFNRPGPRVVEALQIMAEILHPTAFPDAQMKHAYCRIPGKSSGKAH